MSVILARKSNKIIIKWTDFVDFLLQHSRVTHNFSWSHHDNSDCKINTELAVNPFKCCHFTVDTDNGKTWIDSFYEKK